MRLKNPPPHFLPSRPSPFSMTRILESPGSTNWRVIYAIQDLDISKAWTPLWPPSTPGVLGWQRTPLYPRGTRLSVHSPLPQGYQGGSTLSCTPGVPSWKCPLLYSRGTRLAAHSPLYQGYQAGSAIPQGYHANSALPSTKNILWKMQVD